MKLPGLLAPLLLGGGVVPALGKVEIVGDNVRRSEGQTRLGKGMSTFESIAVIIGASELTKHAGLPYQGQDKAPVNQHSRDGASIHSASANIKPIDLDALKSALPVSRSRYTIRSTRPNRLTKPQKNQTKPTLNIQHQDAPIITFKATNPAPAAADPEPPTPDHEPDYPDPASAGASGGAQKRNPATANRAIAGMGAGLVSVMLVFVVFL